MAAGEELMLAIEAIQGLLEDITGGGKAHLYFMPQPIATSNVLITHPPRTRM